MKGIISTLITPFKEDLSLDLDAIKHHIDFLIEKGINAILVNGSVGEFVCLNKDERKTIAEITVDHVNNRVPVIIGVGSCSTDEVIDLAEHAKDVGADYIQLQPPYYFKFDDETLYRHYKTVTEHVDVPLIIYNYPAAVGLDLSPELIAKLAELPNIVGLKDTTKNLGHIQKVISLTRDIKKEFSVFAGSDDMLLPTLTIGGAGAVSGLANFYPSLPVEIYNAFVNNDIDKALKAHNRLIMLRFDLEQICKFLIPIFKEALNLLGYHIKPIVRKPMPTLTENQRESLKNILAKFELL